MTVPTLWMSKQARKKGPHLLSSRNGIESRWPLISKSWNSNHDKREVRIREVRTSGSKDRKEWRAGRRDHRSRCEHQTGTWPRRMVFCG